jgi:hypothetical protein
LIFHRSVPTRKDDSTRQVNVSAGYFETVGTKILAGRDLDPMSALRQQ